MARPVASVAASLFLEEETLALADPRMEIPNRRKLLILAAILSVRLAYTA